MKVATINTVQGIGDLIWVYRKLSNLFDLINFNIFCVSNDAVQRRAQHFVASLPKCGEVYYEVVSSSKYNALARKRCLIGSENKFDYAVNSWLEAGIHLDAIDSHPVNWDLGVSPVEFKLPDKYILVYISGCSHNYGYYQMRESQWADLVISTAMHMKINNVVFIGAPFDKKILSDVAELVSHRANCFVFTDKHILETMWAIKNADYFISYQSGLCMLAEELGTKTFMVWFPEIASMTSAWIRRAHLESGLFRHGFFGSDIKTMINMIKR